MQQRDIEQRGNGIIKLSDHHAESDNGSSGPNMLNDCTAPAGLRASDTEYMEVQRSDGLSIMSDLKLHYTTAHN